MGVTLRKVLLAARFWSEIFCLGLLICVLEVICDLLQIDSDSLGNDPCAIGTDHHEEWGAVDPVSVPGFVGHDNRRLLGDQARHSNSVFMVRPAGDDRHQSRAGKAMSGLRAELVP